MKRLKDLDDNQIDAVFAGQPTREDTLAEIARHLAGARSQLFQTPPPEVQQEHLAAMMEAADSHAAPIAAPARPRRVMGRVRSAAMKLGAGVAALSLSTAGLAYAGVDLPGRAAESAFEVVGIRLPNQGEVESSGKSVSDDVKAIMEGVDETGCAFGQAVAEVASQNRRNEPKEPQDRCARATAAQERLGGQEKTDHAPRGGRSTRSEKSADGKARAADGKARAADGKSRAAEGKSRAAEGKSRAAEGKGKARAEGSKDDGAAGTPSAGRDRGEDASAGGRGTAEQRKAVPDAAGSVAPGPDRGKPEGRGKP